MRLQRPGMSEEALSPPPFPPSNFFFRNMATSCTLLIVCVQGAHPLPNPLNGTVNPRYLDVATRPRDDSGGECMNSGETVLLGSYCSLKHAGLR